MTSISYPTTFFGEGEMHGKVQNKITPVIAKQCIAMEIIKNYFYLFTKQLYANVMCIYHALNSRLLHSIYTIHFNTVMIAILPIK